MIAVFKMAQRRANDKDFSFSNPGSNIKTVYTLDSKNYRLVPVRDIDFDAKIQSYFDETNYKALIERIHCDDPEELREHILRTYPAARCAFYGDISVFQEDYLLNLELVQEVLNLYNLDVLLNSGSNLGDFTEDKEKIEEIPEGGKQCRQMIDLLEQPPELATLSVRLLNLYHILIKAV